MEKNSHLLSLSKRLSINHGEHATFTVDMSFDIDISHENPSNPAKSQTQDSEGRSVCVINKKESNSDKNNHANEPDLVKNHLHNSHESLYSFLDTFGSSPSSLKTDGSRKTGIAITIFMWLLILMFLGFELLQISKGYHWIPHSFLYFLITFVFWIALFKCGIAQCTCKNRSTRTQQDDVIGNFSGQQENV